MTSLTNILALATAAAQLAAILADYLRRSGKR